MTDFVTLDADDLGVDRIATSPTAFALYENVLAAFEKATGAPVLANDYIVTAMIAAAQVTLSKLGADAIANFVKVDNGNEAVGTYGYFTYTPGTLAAGATTAGANLQGAFSSLYIPSGTWRNVGGVTASNAQSSQFQKIAL